MKLEIFTAGLACHHIAAVLLLLSGIDTQSIDTQDVRMPPTIVRSPTKQVTFRIDERIPLECRATGAGTLTYEWTQNKMPMNLNDFRRLDVEGEGETVIIKRVARSDEGFYQCSVSSAYGKALSNTSHLQLATLGEATSKEIFDFTVQEGQPFEIRAQPHKSFPRPVYGWEIATSTEDPRPRKVIFNKRIQMDDDGNLHFAYATLDDSINGNIYRLVTFNLWLDQRISSSFTKIHVVPARDGIRNFAPIVRFPQIVSYVGVVGQNISLRCFFGARPEATHVWRKPEGSNRFLEFYREKTELFIKDIKPEDQGNYICSASNTEGRNEVTLQLEVEAAPEFKTVKDGLQNINATEGDTVTFQCMAEGKPSVTTVWYMNGNTLDNNNIPRRMRISNNNQTLTIENVCRDCFNDDPRTDLMVIQCNVSNVHGYKFSTGYLNILKKTVVTSISAQDKVEVKKDEPGEVIFKCIASSDPSTPVSIEWSRVDRENSKNDYLVYPDNRVIFMDEPGQIRFNVQQNDTAKWLDVMGLYRCKANNSYSSDFKVMSLTIEDIPAGCKSGYFGWRCRYKCQCNGGGSCNRWTGECQNGCTRGSWGVGCLLDNNCKYNDEYGIKYMGSRYISDKGKTCLNWNLQNAYPGKQFPDGNISAVRNYCRNPIPAEESAWCYYQLKPKRKWAYCTLNSCECPLGRYGVNCVSECHCRDGSEQCDSVTGRCHTGCHQHWTGYGCQDCANGYFGQLCNNECNCRVGEACDRDTGYCSSDVLRGGQLKQ